MIPYGRQAVDEDDVRAVSEVLRSAWLTTGPAVEAFERDVAAVAGAAHAVAVSSGTAALHAAMHALDLRPGDEVVVPTITFVATANAVLYEGATPVFADVDPATLLVDPASVERCVGARTRAIVTVDYAGQPCDYEAIGAIARRRGLVLVADGAHALGARLGGRPVGSLADMTVFSFHPVKHVTTGEGGMVVALDADRAAAMRRFRNHGIATDHRQRAERGTHAYEMVDLGFNYRLSDIACALGSSQLRKLGASIARRRAIAARYDAAFAGADPVEPLAVRPDASHAWHLFVVRVRPGGAGWTRDDLFADLRARGIGANVHYLPVHLHPYYRRRLGTGPGLCPRAEEAYGSILSLPMFPAMTDGDVECVIDAVREAARELGRRGGP